MLPSSPCRQQNPFLGFCKIPLFDHLAKFCLDFVRHDHPTTGNEQDVTRIDQLLGLDIIFFTLLNLLLYFQDLDVGKRRQTMIDRIEAVDLPSHLGQPLW